MWVTVVLITDNNCCLQLVFLLSLRQKSGIFDSVSAAASVGASAAQHNPLPPPDGVWVSGGHLCAAETLASI